MSDVDSREKPILSGLRVLDISHQYSGALAACLLCDLGATVVSVEHPKGSPVRTMLPKKDGQSMWWKLIQRGKKCVSLNLSSPKGRELFLKMAQNFDVVVENFRPGTLEKWGLGPKDLEAARLNLIMLRISGFGQTGPLKHLPGFGTVAEAMSGFAYLNGFPDGPPVFPSTTLADGVASTFGAMGVLAALHYRTLHGIKGVKVVDVALFETLFRLIPTQVLGYDQTGYVPKRPGNFLGSHGVLRNVWKTADDVYFCVSGVGEAAIRRIVAATGAEKLAAEVDRGIMHAAPAEVESYLERCNAHIESWALRLPFEEVASCMAKADAVFQRIYNVADIVADPHYKARNDLISVPDRELGPILMQGIMPKFWDHRHEVTHAGSDTGAHNAEVFGELLGLKSADLEKLKADGVI